MRLTNKTKLDNDWLKKLNILAAKAVCANHANVEVKITQSHGGSVKGLCWLNNIKISAPAFLKLDGERLRTRFDVFYKILMHEWAHIYQEQNGMKFDHPTRSNGYRIKHALRPVEKDAEMRVMFAKKFPNELDALFEELLKWIKNLEKVISNKYDVSVYDKATPPKSKLVKNMKYGRIY
jgi:hypothetical protein